jgi:hypothetical protein
MRDKERYTGTVVGPPATLLYRTGFLIIVAGVSIWSGIVGDHAESYVIAGLAVVIAVRTISERMFANAQELTFRNAFRTYRFNWNDIENLNLVTTKGRFYGPERESELSVIAY